MAVGERRHAAFLAVGCVSEQWVGHEPLSVSQDRGRSARLRSGGYDALLCFPNVFKFIWEWVRGLSTVRASIHPLPRVPCSAGEHDGGCRGWRGWRQRQPAQCGGGWVPVDRPQSAARRRAHSPHLQPLPAQGHPATPVWGLPQVLGQGGERGKCSPGMSSNLVHRAECWRK